MKFFGQSADLSSCGFVAFLQLISRLLTLQPAEGDGDLTALAMRQRAALNCGLLVVVRSVDVGRMSSAALLFELGTLRPDRVKAALQAVPAQAEGLRDVLPARLAD